MICFFVDLLGFILFGTLCISCILKSFSFFRFRKFSSIISSYTFSTFFSLSSPSGAPIMQMLVCLMLSQRSLKLSLFFKICFPFHCYDWVIFIILPFRLLMHSCISPNLLLIPSSIFFISLTVFFSSDWFFFIFSSFLLIF